MRHAGLILLSGGIVAAILVATSPSVLWWGERHTAHERPQRFLLTSTERIGQTFIMEQPSLAGVAVWVDPAKALPRAGEMEIDVTVGQAHATARYAGADIPPSGIVVFRFDSPLIATKGAQGTYMLSVIGEGQSVSLEFQIDEEKYRDGYLVHPDSTRQGDLAFQLLYKKSVFGGYGAQIGYGLLLACIGIIMWQGHVRYKGERIRIDWRDVVWAIGGGVLTAVVYGVHLVRVGYWFGPTDFTKDAAYLGSFATALKAWVWPVWTHTICGGLPLIGAIEGNGISVGTILALWMNSQHALMLMNVLEAGIGAAGVYALGRFFSGSRIGSFTSAIIYAFSPWYLFKIVIGYSMIGAVFAYAPWVMLLFGASLRYSSAIMALGSGILLALTVLRGEAHIVVVLGLLVVIWGVYEAIVRKHLQALFLLLLCCSMALFLSSSKVLPYIEHLPNEPIKIQPYVTLLVRQNLLAETLLTVGADHESVPVLHGRRGEVWGVFGSYVGVLPLVLAFIGAIGIKQYRKELFLFIIVSLLLAEGTVFEYALRFIPPLDALLRMPVRNMLLFILFLSIFSGRGVDSIARYIPSPIARRVFYSIVIGFLLIDLTRAGSIVSRTVREDRGMQSVSRITSPSFANYTVYEDGTGTANILLAQGYLLPQVCADQDRTVSFIKNITSDTLLANVPATLAPNTITLDVPRQLRDIFVQARFDSQWTSEDASILEHVDGSLHVIAHDSNTARVVLKQQSPTKRAQQMILLTVAIYLTTISICEKVKRCSGKKHG